MDTRCNSDFGNCESTRCRSVLSFSKNKKARRLPLLDVENFNDKSAGSLLEKPYHPHGRTALTPITVQRNVRG